MARRELERTEAELRELGVNPEQAEAAAVTLDEEARELQRKLRLAMEAMNG